MDITTITLHRTDLAEDSTVFITVTEWERVCDLIEAAAKRADIEIETMFYGLDRWVFDVDAADVDPINAIIDGVVEGDHGAWTDAALLALAVHEINARRGMSGTWWGDGYAGIDDAAMATVGWLIQLGRADEVGDYLNECSDQLDADIHPDNLIDIAASTYDLRQRDDGLWISERFRGLYTSTVEHAGRLLRRGFADEAYVALIDGEIKIKD